MIPTRQRLRANRIGSAVAAVLVGGVCAGAAWIVFPSPATLAPAAGAAVVAAAGVYRLATRRWRRRVNLLRRPFPTHWRQILEEHVAFYNALSPEPRQRFRDMVAIFLDETPIHAVGFELDDVCRVLVAASAVIPVFGLPGWQYRMLREVLLYPDSFDSAVGLEDDGYVDEEGTMGMVGETGTAFNGLMMLSRPDLLYGYQRQHPREEVENVGIHEFAHLIDKADGFIDGLPPGLSRQSLAEWLQVVRKELERPRRRSGIPEYGYSDEEEFFAVAVECFFTRPAKMAARHPELYALLVQALGQDPRPLLGGKR